MTLEERLSKLEKLVIEMIKPVALVNPANPKYISVSAIHFEDENGRSRGMIGITEEGKLGLNFSDEQGNPRVVLNFGPGHPGLIISDENRIRVQLAMSEQGPALIINNEDGNPSIMLIDSKAGPVLRRFTKNGENIPIC